MLPAPDQAAPCLPPMIGPTDNQVRMIDGTGFLYCSPAPAPNQSPAANDQDQLAVLAGAVKGTSPIQSDITARMHSK